jgi:hypothetical protein
MQALSCDPFGRQSTEARQLASNAIVAKHDDLRRSPFYPGFATPTSYLVPSYARWKRTITSVVGAGSRDLPPFNLCRCMSHLTVNDLSPITVLSNVLCTVIVDVYIGVQPRLPTMGFFKKPTLKVSDDKRTRAAELTLRESIYPLCLVTILFFLWVRVSSAYRSYRIPALG